MKKITFICILLFNLSCVEELDLIQETSFESVLIVEATITDVYGYQEVKLSRSYAIDANGPLLENNANVKVIGSDGSTYNFQENSEGIYISTVPFFAQPNIEYHIEITTSNGNQYKSTNSSLTSLSQISDLYIERDFNENMEEGVSIYVDAENPNNVPQLFRYEYEETYKIIAPQYDQHELIINNVDYPYPQSTFQGFTASEIVEFFVIKQLREEEDQKRICYNTVASNKIDVVQSQDFEQNILEKYRIRFISRLNYIMSHRYSILVKQFTQSSEGHEFYKTLKELSLTQSVFSQVQPGFLIGNINAITHQNESVAGFFEVASVDERRIYFNYEDVFPGEDLPPYDQPCFALQEPDLYTTDEIGNITGSPIQREILEGNTFYIDNFEDELDFTNYFYPYRLTVSPSCGDCTALGSTVVPDFWEE